MSANVAGTAAYTPAAGITDTSPAITRDRRFQELVRSRNSLALALSIIMMALYVAFILLVAFDKPLLATKVAGTTSLGILMGLVLIVVAFVLTAVYVARANGRFDDLNNELVREYGR